MRLYSLGVDLEGDHHIFKKILEHTTEMEASGFRHLASKKPRSQSSKINKSTVKKSCGENKLVWWKCRMDLDLYIPKISTSLGGRNESIEKNGLQIIVEARGKGR